MRDIVLVAHNVRSTYNVGALLRTADGLGATKLYMTGYTPYPAHDADERMPHLAQKISRAIHKTALGSETAQAWEHVADVFACIDTLRQDGYAIVAVEQSAHSLPLNSSIPPQKIAIIVGREVEGVEPEVLNACDQIYEIPMFGAKESFNVSVAAAIALYHCRFSAFARAPGDVYSVS